MGALAAEAHGMATCTDVAQVGIGISIGVG